MPANNPFELGKSRVEALSDGLFAIAMTILVLGFKVPSLPSTAPNVEVVPAIVALWPALVAYSVAFIGIGVYWILHHMVFHAVRVVDGTLLWLNILFFLFISVLPFSVQLVNQFPRAQVAPVLFGANLALAGWMLSCQWLYVLARPRLMVETLPAAYRETVGLRVTIAPVAATLTALICFWSVTTSLVIYALLLPLYFLPVRPNAKHSTVAADGEPAARRSLITPQRLLMVGGVLAVLVGWFLFRPELLLINSRVNENLALAGAREVSSGEFKGLAHETNGHVAIYDLHGKYVLRFTGFSTSNGPDVHVYLVAAPDAFSDDVVRNEGDQNYELPAGVDLSTYRSVSLWCQRFKVNFGACSLR